MNSCLGWNAVRQALNFVDTIRPSFAYNIKQYHFKKKKSKKNDNCVQILALFQSIIIYRLRLYEQIKQEKNNSFGEGNHNYLLFKLLDYKKIKKIKIVELHVWLVIKLHWIKIH